MRLAACRNEMNSILAANHPHVILCSSGLVVAYGALSSTQSSGPRFASGRMKFQKNSPKSRAIRNTSAKIKKILRLVEAKDIARVRARHRTTEGQELLIVKSNRYDNCHYSMETTAEVGVQADDQNFATFGKVTDVNVV